MKNILLFGASSGGQRALPIFKNKTNILCFIDNSKRLIGTFIDGIKVEHPDHITKASFDEIIICSSYHKEIKEQLIKQYQVPDDKISILNASIMKGTQTIGDPNRMNAAINTIKTVADIYDTNEIFYYLDHGTLLGIIRDGDLLDWDNDVDFAINAEDAEQAYLVAKEKFTTPYDVKKVYRETDTGDSLVRLIRIEYNDQALADIILKEKFNEKRLWYVGFTRLQVDDQMHKKVKKIKFHGFLVNIPEESEKYLSILYGDWKNEVEDWNHSMYKNIYE